MADPELSFRRPACGRLAGACVMVQLTPDKARVDAKRFCEGLGFVASHEGMKLHLGTASPPG